MNGMAKKKQGIITPCFFRLQMKIKTIYLSNSYIKLGFTLQIRFLFFLLINSETSKL